MELAEGQDQVSSSVTNNDPWLQLKAETTIQVLQPLLEEFFSVSQSTSSGLTMLPNRAKL